MKSRIIVAAVFAAASLFVAGTQARAQSSGYVTFTAGAQGKHGLFTIWQKGNKTYLELAPNQFNKDYLETIVPGNGLGQQPVWWGDTDYIPSELVRFERRGDQVVILWPNWYAQAPGSPSAELANLSNFPDSVVGIGAIAAEDPASGDIVFDVSSLLNDQLDLRNIIDQNLPPDRSYRLDPSLSYVDKVKAFPENDVITVSQTWSTDAKHVIDTAPDARRLRIFVVYNFVQLPNDNYRPRFADDRVGIYNDIYLDFANDRRDERLMRYLIRWNFDPADPNRPSVARHPMVITLSNTIPPQYRQAVTDACLVWNKAYAKIGILNAVQVQPQPSDPNFDPDDFRYNVIRWLNEASPGFGADSQTLFDPRTGEEIRTGVIVSAVEGTRPYSLWKYTVDPVRFGRTTDPVPAKFIHDSVFSALVHEMGHNQGLQHNFIGHEAFTAAQLQSEQFTRAHGVASSVMEYAPLNLWPRGISQGEFFQTTLGPYDYYAIKYGYANIPGARTPADEIPTLHRWASGWSNPWTRYASDEDVSWQNGHAADPRVDTGMLTNNELRWCDTQMNLDRSRISQIARLWPQSGQSYQQELDALRTPVSGYFKCAQMPAHYLGGQYLSRAHAGDPGSAPPVVPVDRIKERQAFELLAKYLLAANPLNISPAMLQHLSYAEWSGYGYTGWDGYGNLPLWAYNPPVRHDYTLTQRVNAAQMQTIDYLFNPVVLARIDENPALAIKPTMSIADLFNWLHAAIYNDLSMRDIALVRRNLQAAFVDKMGDLANKAAKGTPADAIALARVELHRIASAAAKAMRGNHDEITAAHLLDLVHRANAASNPPPAP
ncbi:MAG TPA: zinc-dependent metalloprotease [Candidatus Rubrimentiphilum sp.]|nr:zinc-dependent metalloprotease [Candidatus Rubrimentiphilum sp.]